jgi:hypothetical protein
MKSRAVNREVVINAIVFRRCKAGGLYPDDTRQDSLVESISVGDIPVGTALARGISCA